MKWTDLTHGDDLESSVVAGATAGRDEHYTMDKRAKTEGGSCRRSFVAAARMEP